MIKQRVNFTPSYETAHFTYTITATPMVTPSEAECRLIVAYKRVKEIKKGFFHFSIECEGSFFYIPKHLCWL